MIDQSPMRFITIVRAKFRERLINKKNCNIFYESYELNGSESNTWFG